MKAADLPTANAISTRLAKIAAIKAGQRDTSRPVQFLILVGQSNDWVPLSKAASDKAYLTMLAELDAEAASLRRRAAQIGLSL